MERAISVQFELLLAAVLMLASASSTAEPAGSFSSAKTDAESLILFKKMIESDPNGALSGWQLSKDPCTWSGVTCKLGRVAQLDLTQSGLVGQITLSPFASMDNLTALNLSGNSFDINSTSLMQLRNTRTIPSRDTSSCLTPAEAGRAPVGSL